MYWNLAKIVPGRKENAPNTCHGPPSACRDQTERTATGQHLHERALRCCDGWYLRADGRAPTKRYARLRDMRALHAPRRGIPAIPMERTTRCQRLWLGSFCPELCVAFFGRHNSLLQFSTSSQRRDFGPLAWPHLPTGVKKLQTPYCSAQILPGLPVYLPLCAKSVTSRCSEALGTPSFIYEHSFVHVGSYDCSTPCLLSAPRITIFARFQHGSHEWHRGRKASVLEFSW